MRILIVGAGALGGYVGARLLAAHKDVTFLVRPTHAEQLVEKGLQLNSPLGSYSAPAVRFVTADTIHHIYDLVIVACKTYSLTAATLSLGPALGADTVILPLLNGVAHLNHISRIHGVHRLIGGQCMLAATRTPDGTIRHLNNAHSLRLGELDGSLSPRVMALGSLFSDAGFPRTVSQQIVLEMWEKFAFISSALCMTVLTRVDQDRPASKNEQIADALLNECRAVAASLGITLRSIALSRARMILEAPEATLFNLLFDDLLRYPETEADTLLEDLARHAQDGAVTAPNISQAQALLRHYRGMDVPRTAQLQDATAAMEQP
ncbi:2-dehydropantoate 2-reductase [Herbaspirillum seropedicae]|uniref:ketopantoate reductase family protein n=1 Tax=Herbaspirillum seropedicae TaxID=964 RepID=UPI00339745FC